MMKKIVLAITVLIATLASMSAVAALGDTHLTTPYTPYWNSGATRTTAYASTFAVPDQGFFSYAGAPTGLVRYGVGYHWGENVRWPSYGNDPHTLEPGIYRRYYGYPAQGYGNPYFEYARRYS